jgi:hypothetical protein
MPYVLLLLTLIFASCNSIEPSELQFDERRPAGGEVFGGTRSGSIEAFERTVYPITRQYCVSCHATQSPRHAAENVSIAHDAVVSGFKVNFDNIPSSRLVAKVRDERHSCWSNSCSQDALLIEKAIEQWHDLIKDSHGGGADSGAIITARSKTVSELERGLPYKFYANQIHIDLSKATLNAHMQRGVEEGIPFIWMPQQGRTFSIDDPSAGRATVEISVPVAGEYAYYSLVKWQKDGDARGSVFLGITDSNITGGSWTGIRANDSFTWRKKNNSDFMLKAGKQTLTISTREDGLKMAHVILAAVSDFDPDLAEFKGVTLSYDISALVGVQNARFEVEVREFDEFSYEFTNPRIHTAGKKIRAKGIKLHINGFYNPQNSLFTTINSTATAEAEVLSNLTMIALKDRGNAEDVFSFSFDELKVVP